MEFQSATKANRKPPKSMCLKTFDWKVSSHADIRTGTRLIATPPRARRGLAAAAETAQPIQVFEARNADQVVAGVDAAANGGVAGLLTLEDALLASTRRQIAERAITTRLPIVYGSRAFPEAGGLISYGVDRRHMYRRAAEYVDKILKGANPAEVPVEQPTKFELVINLKAAKAIGVEVPAKLLALADDVIESSG